MVVSSAKGKLTWNAVASGGMASVGLSIDGKSVSSIGGPYAAPVGVNYSAAIGSRLAGSHSYVITATDKAGHSSTLDGTFNIVAASVAGPTISGVVVSMAKAKISWNVADASGVAGVGLSIDGKTVTGIGGPYAAASGSNYCGSFRSLAAGDHSYVITATDKARPARLSAARSP